GDPAGAGAVPTDARRARGCGPAGPDAAAALALGGAGRWPWRSCAVGGPGSRALGPRADRGGDACSRGGDGSVVDWPVSGAGRDRLAPRPGAASRADRLVADRRAVRIARADDAVAGRPAEPRGRGRDGG